MQKFIIFYYFLSLTFGCAAVIVTFLVYLSNRMEIFRNYIFFLVSVTFFVILNSFSVYRYFFSNTNDPELTMMTLNLFLLCLGSIIYFLPLFIHSLLDLKMKRWVNYLLIFLAGLSVVLIFIPYGIATGIEDRLSTGKFIMYYIYCPILFVVCFYVVFLFITKYKRITNSILKVLVRNMFILIAVFVPLLILVDMNANQLEVVWKVIPFGLTLLPLFYLLICLFSMIYATRYLFIKPFQEFSKTGEISVSDIFMKRFNITKREKEIIELLIMDYSYKKITEKYFISMGTVKNHTHNIYNKTGTHGIDQLKNLILTFK